MPGGKKITKIVSRAAFEITAARHKKIEAGGKVAPIGGKTVPRQATIGGHCLQEFGDDAFRRRRIRDCCRHRPAVVPPRLMPASMPLLHHYPVRCHPV